MQNKPFIVLVLLAALVGNRIDVTGKCFCDDEISATSNLDLGVGLFPVIPNSSVDSRSSESSASGLYCCCVVCTCDGDVLI